MLTRFTLYTILALLIAVAAYATSITTLAQGNEVAAIYKVQARTPRGLGGGTAFLIKHPHTGQVVAITNRHVCEINPPDGIFELEKVATKHLAKIVKLSKQADLCLLEVKYGFGPFKDFATLKLATKSAPKDSEVHAAGYAMLQTMLTFSGVVMDYRLLPVDEEDPQMSGKIAGATSFPIFHGNSGSPLLNKEGEVVGVMFAYTASAEGLFVPLKALLYFLSNSEG